VSDTKAVAATATNTYPAFIRMSNDDLFKLDGYNTYSAKGSDEEFTLDHLLTEDPQAMSADKGDADFTPIRVGTRWFWDGEQGDPEWHELRNLRMTGSRVGAMLGLSPFQKNAGLLKDMVNEAMGNGSMFDNPAMAWGREHEAHAVEEYTLIYAPGAVQVAGMFGVDAPFKMGYSPDRLVGDRGLLEVKCPYSLRNDDTPEFKSINELQHYMAQIQLGMLLLDKDWCDFYQWAPDGDQCERVMADPNWWDTILSGTEIFMPRLDDAMANPVEYGIAGRDDNKWIEAAAELVVATAQASVAGDRLTAAKDALKALAPDGTQKGCGVYVRHDKVTGSVDYKKLALTQFKSTPKWEEKYRKAGSTKIVVGVDKPKKGDTE
jgi:putative phage-type endonuclease